MPLQLSWQSISFVRRRSRVRSSLEAECSHGLVGYDARLTRERSRVRASVRILNFFGFVYILFFGHFFQTKTKQIREIKSKKIQVQKIIKSSSSPFGPLSRESRYLPISIFLLKEALGMIQACIMLLSHIIHRKVWNCRIQVFSKLVESIQPTLSYL